MSSHINFWEVPYSFGVKKQVYCTLGCLYFSLKDTTAGAGKKNISQLPQNKIHISPVLVTKKAPKPLFESLFSSPDGCLPPEQLGTTAVLVPPKSGGNSLAVRGEVGLGMRNPILSKSDQKLCFPLSHSRSEYITYCIEKVRPLWSVNMEGFVLNGSVLKPWKPTISYIVGSGRYKTFSCQSIQTIQVTGTQQSVRILWSM